MKTVLAIWTLACLGFGIVISANAPLPKADSPKVEVPAEVTASGDYVKIEPKTDAKTITYIGLSGVEAFPAELLKDRKIFVFYTRGLKPGKYQFKGVASLNDEHTVFPLTVLIEGDTPLPPVPLDKFGLVKASKDGLAKQTESTKRTALALAQSNLASAVAAGAYGDDPAKILAAWQEANRKAVGSENWSEWGKSVSSKLEEQYKAGKIKKASDWADAFNDIASGLASGQK